MSLSSGQDGTSQTHLRPDQEQKPPSASVSGQLGFRARAETSRQPGRFSAQRAGGPPCPRSPALALSGFPQLTTQPRPAVFAASPLPGPSSHPGAT